MGPKCQRCRIHRSRYRRQCYDCRRFVAPGCKPEECLAIDGRQDGGVSLCRDCYDASTPQTAEEPRHKGRAQDLHAQTTRCQRTWGISYREDAVHPDWHDSTEPPCQAWWCKTARKHAACQHSSASSGSFKHRVHLAMGTKCQRCRVHRPHHRRKCHGCRRFVGPGCNTEGCLAIEGLYNGELSFCRDCQDATTPQWDREIGQGWCEQNRRSACSDKHSTTTPMLSRCRLTTPASIQPEELRRARKQSVTRRSSTQ